ncbi:hypothetical protein pb186bvf_000084 [Paramecium bursaria]
MNKIKSQIVFKGEQTEQKPVPQQKHIDKGKIIQARIGMLQESRPDAIVVECDYFKANVNDDIKREQEFYRLAQQAVNKLQNKGRNSNTGLVKDIKEIVQSGLVKQAVYVKNETEKELKAQGKKIQQMITSKQVSEEKQQRLLEQIKKAISKNVDTNQEIAEEIETPQIERRNVFKKGIKQKKVKRIGKQARLRKHMKRMSRK